MSGLKGDFRHVVEAASINDIGQAINRAEINLAYSPLPISVAGQSYIDSMDLGPNGEFNHIGYAPQYQNVSLYRELAWFRAGKLQDLQPVHILAQLDKFPEREGKKDFAEAISTAATTFWYAQKGKLPLQMTLMEKTPAADTFFHLDGMEDGRDMRGLVTFRGGLGTRFMDNAQAQIFEGGRFGFKTVLGPAADLAQTIEVRDVPIGALSIHKGLISRTVPDFVLGKNGYPILWDTRADPMAEQNPLGHAEPSDGDCNGESRLQLMIDQVPNTPNYV